jgi:hypothetical protein
MNGWQKFTESSRLPNALPTIVTSVGLMAAEGCSVEGYESNEKKFSGRLFSYLQVFRPTAAVFAGLVTRVVTAR